MSFTRQARLLTTEGPVRTLRNPEDEIGHAGRGGTRIGTVMVSLSARSALSSKMGAGYE